MIATLTDEHYTRILQDLEAQGLSYDPLRDDLADHLCCMLEEAMEGGRNFEQAYRQLREGLEPGTLASIQHQTLINLDKKHQQMKTLTYVFGLTGGILTALGAILRLIHLPGASLLVTIGIFLIVAFFFPFYLAGMKREEPDNKLPAYSIVGYIASSIVLIGILFKMQHWPGAGIALTLGVLLIVVAFLPMYFVRMNREADEKRHPLLSIVGYLTISLVLVGALFKMQHWPGAGYALTLAVSIALVGFIPLYIVAIFQKGGRYRVGFSYMIMVMLGVTVFLIMSNVNIGKYMIDIYQDEALANDRQVEEIQARTTGLLERYGDSLAISSQGTSGELHRMAAGIQLQILDMKDGMKRCLGQEGISLEDVRGKDSMRAGKVAILNSGKGREFGETTLEFRQLLEASIEDPVAMAQILDHLEFTSEYWHHEFSPKDVGSTSFIKNYYKLSDAAKGVALAEYVALTTLLHP